MLLGLFTVNRNVLKLKTTAALIHGYRQCSAHVNVSYII